MPADALLKKLNRGGGGRPALPEAAAMGGALARGVEDGLRPLVGCPLAAQTSAPRILRLEEAAGAIAAPALIGVAKVGEAGGSESAILVAVDYALAWHMTDLTLGGDPSSAPSPLPRPLTAIDLALGRLHLQALLAAVSAALAVGLGRSLPRPAALVEIRADLADLRIAPERSDALELRLSVALGEAGRRGGLAVILPLGALDALRAAAGAAAGPEEERPDDLWRIHMRGVVAAAPIALDAVLHRQMMTLAAVRALHTGQLLKIPRESAEAIQIRLAQPGGRAATVATGRLGALGDHKVLKLDSAPDPRLVQHVAGALRPGGQPTPAPQPPALAVEPGS